MIASDWECDAKLHRWDMWFHDDFRICQVPMSMLVDRQLSTVSIWWTFDRAIALIFEVCYSYVFFKRRWRKLVCANSNSARLTPGCYKHVLVFVNCRSARTTASKMWRLCGRLCKNLCATCAPFVRRLCANLCANCVPTCVHILRHRNEHELK